MRRAISVGFAAAVAVALAGQSAAAARSATACSGAPVTRAEAIRLAGALDDARRASGTPGAAAAIAACGRIVWSGASGHSDRAGDIPITPRTMFVLASVSKLFVATVAMRLAEQGRLRLDDPIAPYAPGYMRDAAKVTVLDLLGHTSGYKDDEADPAVLRLLADPNHVWTRAMLERREGPVQFAPGSRFEYCNSCYVLLGTVVESAGGAPIGDELRRYVFAPLALEDDVAIERSKAFAARIAHGYDLRGGRLVDTFDGAHDLGVPTYDWGPVWTDGGVAATADGVARFASALFGGRLVSAASLATMLAPGGKGEIVEAQRHDGRTWRGHSGFYDGFTAEAWYDARRDLTIVVLANRTDDSDPATGIWNRFATAFDRLRP